MGPREVRLGERRDAGTHDRRTSQTSGLGPDGVVTDFPSGDREQPLRPTTAPNLSPQDREEPSLPFACLLLQVQPWGPTPVTAGRPTLYKQTSRVTLLTAGETPCVYSDVRPGAHIRVLAAASARTSRERPPFPP